MRPNYDTVERENLGGRRDMMISLWDESLAVTGTSRTIGRSGTPGGCGSDDAVRGYDVADRVVQHHPVSSVSSETPLYTILCRFSVFHKYCSRRGILPRSKQWNLRGESSGARPLSQFGSYVGLLILAEIIK